MRSHSATRQTQSLPGTLLSQPEADIQLPPLRPKFWLWMYVLISLDFLLEEGVLLVIAEEMAR